MNNKLQSDLKELESKILHYESSQIISEPCPYTAEDAFQFRQEIKAIKRKIRLNQKHTSQSTLFQIN